MTVSAPKASTSGRRFRGLSPAERQAQRRRQLLEAGLEAFGEDGFHATGVRDLCARAKLTERYFYESFDNREALFWAVYEEAVDRAREAVAAAVAGEDSSDPSTTARAGLRAYLETIHGEPRLARILLVEVLAVGADEEHRPLAAMREFSELVSSAVERAEPLLPADLDRSWIADGLVGSTVHIVLAWATGGFQEPVERVLDHCAVFYDAIAETARAGEAQSPSSRPFRKKQSSLAKRRSR